MIFSVTRFFHCFRYTLILTRGCPESRCGESRWKWFLEDFSDFSEFSRKFALKNSEKAYGVGVRFSLEIRKRVWEWFETPRRLYSVEVPGKRQGVLFILFKKKTRFCSYENCKNCVCRACCACCVCSVRCVRCVRCGFSALQLFFSVVGVLGWVCSSSFCLKKWVNSEG